MARTTTRHKGHDFLGIYLNDHLAGATGGVGLAGGWRQPPTLDRSQRES